MGKLCVNYASSSSLGHLRFLVFLLLGYAGFLRVDELHSLKVGDISLLMTIWQSPSGSEETTSIEKAIQFTSPSRVHLTGSSSETPLIRKIVKSKKSECFHPTKEISTTTNREEFNTHVLPFAVNIQQLSMYSLKSGAAWNSGCCSLHSDLIDRHAAWRCSSSKRRYIKY